MRIILIVFALLWGPLSAQAERIHCPYGDCPRDAWTDGDKPPMRCHEFPVSQFIAQIHTELEQRLAGARVRINSNRRNGEPTFVEIGGIKYTERSAPHQVLDGEAASFVASFSQGEYDRGSLRERVFYFHDINSTSVELGRRPNTGRPVFHFDVEFESDKPEIKGYCERCLDFRQDRAVNDAQYGKGDKHKRPWTVRYHLSPKIDFDPDGKGVMTFWHFPNPQHSLPGRPDFDIKSIREELRIWAELAMDGYYTWIGNVIILSTMYRLPNEVLLDITGEPSAHLYYLGFKTNERGHVQNDHWRACFRIDPISSEERSRKIGGVPKQSPLPKIKTPPPGLKLPPKRSN